MVTEKKYWQMPEWMQPYTDFIFKGYTVAQIEELYNDNKTTLFANAPRSLIILEITTKVDLVTKLFEHKYLNI